MIILRFQETFRERMPEWIQSVGMLCWGLVVLAADGLFEEVHYFETLLLIMSQVEWAFLAIVVGAIRLIFLIINGAWRPSAHIRAIGCVLGSLLWGTMLVASLSLEYLTPSIVIYGVMLSLDLLSLWFSAGDAKLADITARG